MTGIAETGFLVAFANRKDRHHDWALELASRIDRALLTCDAVLAETPIFWASILVLTFCGAPAGDHSWAFQMTFR